MNAEVLQEIMNIRSWESLLKQYEEKGFEKKNSDLSSQVRNEGNKLYLQPGHTDKTHQKILILYTKSIALATENSEELALAYSNRSALLMHLKKYKECLIDSDKAYKITKSLDLKRKILLRKEKCLSLINEENNIVENLNCKQKSLITSCAPGNSLFLSMMKKGGIPNELFEGRLMFPKTGILNDIEKQIEKQEIPKLELPNEIIPSFSNCLNLTYSKEYGRHVVSTRNISPGEILVIEKGFVFPDVEKMYLACSHCLNFTWNGIPCDSCVFAIYCSEKCKINAWNEYHDIECHILPPFFSEAFYTLNLSHEILPLRLLIMFIKKEGLQNIIDQAKSIENSTDAQLDRFLTNAKLDSAKFSFYFNLISQSREEEKENNDEYGSIATLLLSKYTSILKNVKDFEYLEKCVQLKKLIVKFKIIADNNGLSFSDFDCECERPEDCSFKCPKILGSIIAPTSSFFNHSCSKNVERIFCKDGRIMLFSVKPIKKNEQLFLNYGLGLSTPKKERRISLKQMYQFTCNCEPCKNDWIVDPFNWKPDSQRIMKILKEFKEFEKDLAKQENVEHASMTRTAELIKLAYENLNNFDAFMFCINYVVCLSLYMSKLYGVDTYIPKEC